MITAHLKEPEKRTIYEISALSEMNKNKKIPLVFVC